jgi:hypothetical protein
MLGVKFKRPARSICANSRSLTVCDRLLLLSDHSAHQFNTDGANVGKQMALFW